MTQYSDYEAKLPWYTAAVGALGGVLAGTGAGVAGG